MKPIFTTVVILLILTWPALAFADESMSLESMSLEELMAGARQAHEAYQEAGADSTVPHPADVWAPRLWRWAREHPEAEMAKRIAEGALDMNIDTGRYEEALLMLETVPPDDLYWQQGLEEMFRISYLQGNFDRLVAKAASIREHQKDPRVLQSVLATLGFTYWEQGQQDQAKTSLELAIEKAPDSERAAQIRASLRELSEMSVGKRIPDFETIALDGTRIRRQDLRGQVVVMAFWATWCPPCVKGIPTLSSLYRRYGDKGLTLVSFSLDENLDAARRMIAEKEMIWPQVCEGKGRESKYVELFHVNGTPKYIVLDRDGKILARKLRVEDVEEVVAAALESS